MDETWPGAMVCLGNKIGNKNGNKFGDFVATTLKKPRKNAWVLPPLGVVGKIAYIGQGCPRAVTRQHLRQIRQFLFIAVKRCLHRYLRGRNRHPSLADIAAELPIHSQTT